MIKYEIKGTDTYYYREMLPNGLDIILLPDDNDKKKNYFINFSVSLSKEKLNASL